MPSNHLILCHPLLLLPSIFASSRVFSNESALLIRWPKYWNFSFSITPSNEYSGLISFRIDWFNLFVNIGMISIRSTLATLAAFCPSREASTHLAKVSVKTNKYWSPGKRVCERNLFASPLLAKSPVAGLGLQDGEAWCCLLDCGWCRACRLNNTSGCIWDPFPCKKKKKKIRKQL